MRISSILTLIPLFFLIKTLVGVFFTTRKFRSNSKKLNEWSEFNKKLLNWGDEIVDKSVKQEYLQFCIDRIMITKSMDITSITNMDLDILKQEVIRRYSNHIPSLKKEVRDQKINKILNRNISR